MTVCKAAAVASMLAIVVAGLVVVNAAVVALIAQVPLRLLLLMRLLVRPT